MNARRSIRRASAREGRGRGTWAVLLALAVCLAVGPAIPATPALAGVWTQLGSLPIPNLTAVCRSDRGSIVVATKPVGSPADSSDVWEYDGLTLSRLSARYAPRPIFGSIYSLAVAPDGDVWVGCDKGAFRLAPGGFTQYTRNDGLGSRLVDVVHAILVAPDGTVWAGTEGGGLSRFDGSTWTSLRSPDDGLPSNFVEGLSLGADATLWIAMHNTVANPGLAYLRSGAITPGPATPNDLSKIVAASDGRVWAVSSSNGAYLFDASGSLLTQYQAPTIANDLTSVTEGPNGDIWIGSFSSGVYQFDGGAWQNFSGSSGLTSSTARDLITDSAGVLWVATANGLFRYEGSLWVAFTPSSFPGMNGARVLSISRGPASDFGGPPPARGVTRGPTYVGLGSLPPPMPGGVCRIVGSTVTAVLDSVGQPLAGPYVVSALPDGAWAGQGARLAQITGTSLTRLLPTPDGANVLTILGRPDRTAWAGTTQNLLRYGIGTWQVVPLPGVTPAQVKALAADSSGGIWIGTSSNGAARFDGTGVHAVTGVPGGAVTAITVAPAGDVWIGVQTSGVAHVPAGSTAVDRVLGVADGLPNLLVQSLGVDQTGRLWVGTTNGLVYLEPGAAALYNTGDGLQTSNVTAMLADTSEALLGSDSNGLALFHRDALAPRVAFTDVPAAVIPARTARVDFAGGDLSSDNAQVAFSWSLDGAPGTPFTTDRTARLSALTDGAHELRVWSRDRALNVTPTPATVDFEVDATPPQPVLARPAFGSVVRGVTPIVAIVDEPRFASWTLGVRPAGQEDPVLNPWQTLGTANTPPVSGATLLEWDTKPYLDGIYEMRFAVADTLGLTGYAIVNTTVDNLSPGNSVTSPARVDNTNGGRVFTLNAEVELYFPPHALDEDRVVTIDTLVDLAVPPQPLPPGASELVSAWHVTPAGFATRKPVTVTLDERFFAPGGAGSDLAVFAVAPDGSYSYLGGSTDATNGTLVTTTSVLGDFVVARGLFTGLAGPGRQLDVQPRAFSPIGTTFDTRAAISFNLESAEGARVFVYDRSGRLVRRVFDGALAAGKNVVYWDGRDGHGDVAPSGLYLVAVEVAGKAEVRSVAVVNR